MVSIDLICKCNSFMQAMNSGIFVVFDGEFP